MSLERMGVNSASSRSTFVSHQEYVIEDDQRTGCRGEAY
jgi:hypothetical protein